MPLSHADMQCVARGLAPVMGDYVQKQLAPVLERLAKVERRLALAERKLKEKESKK